MAWFVQSGQASAARSSVSSKGLSIIGLHSDLDPNDLPSSLLGDFVPPALTGVARQDEVSAASPDPGLSPNQTILAESEATPEPACGILTLAESRPMHRAVVALAAGPLTGLCIAALTS